MGLDTFIITAFCIIDDTMNDLLQHTRLRQRGPKPALSDSEVLTIELEISSCLKDAELLYPLPEIAKGIYVRLLHLCVIVHSCHLVYPLANPAPNKREDAVSSEAASLVAFFQSFCNYGRCLTRTGYLR